MSDLGNSLKTLINNTVNSQVPSNVYFATMISPTQIQLDGSEGPLPEIYCVIPDYLRSYKVNFEGTFHDEVHSGEVTIDNSLKTGDKVIVLKKLGGLKYFVLGRL